MIGGYHTVKVLGKQRRESLTDGEADAFADGVRRPAIEHVPRGPFAGVVVNSGDPQAGPKFRETTVERGAGKAAPESLAQFEL